jgi:hypothetical protein
VSSRTVATAAFDATQKPSEKTTQATKPAIGPKASSM